MLKWIISIVFVTLSVISINASLDDTGSSVADIIPAVATVLALLFASLTFFIWRRTYAFTKSPISLMFMLLPAIAISVYSLCAFAIYRKVNKPYHLFASLPGDHNYEYYFRDDSTLKIVGHFALSAGQTFQDYKMAGNTILLDTIIPCTGIVSKRYIWERSNNSDYQLLIPVDEKGQRIDSMTLYTEEKTTANRRF
jgi:hypothetical protein